MLVDINLLPQKERDRPAFIIAAISILVLAIIIWAVLFFLAQRNDNAQEELAAQSAELALQQAELRTQLEQTVGLNEEQQLQVTVDWAESYQYDTVPLLDELVAILPDRGFFHELQYIGPNTAILDVQFDNTRDAAYYLTQLKASALLASATLDLVEFQSLTETEEEIIEESEIEIPRYIATYSLIFVDERLPAEGSVETPEGIEEVAEEEVIEEPVEEVPVEEEVIEETETAPETEADGQ